MPWSTRELAELSGTTVNTIRFYHQRGLLPEPDRDANGYKRYDVAHLIRLLRIRRLRDLGAKVSDIDPGASLSPQALADLDAQLAETIERSIRARADIAEMTLHQGTTDVPSGFADISARLTENQRSLMLVYAQLYDADTMAQVRQMLEVPPAPATVEFEALAADADEATRSRVAQAYAKELAQAMVDYPWLRTQREHLTKSESVTGAAIGAAIHDIYNAAQRDVLVRASAMAQERFESSGQ